MMDRLRMPTPANAFLAERIKALESRGRKQNARRLDIVREPVLS
jgi:hypothetical protein